MNKTNQRILWDYRQQANLWEPLPNDMFLETGPTGEVQLPGMEIAGAHLLFVSNQASRAHLGNARRSDARQITPPGEFKLSERDLVQLGYVTMLEAVWQQLNR